MDASRLLFWADYNRNSVCSLFAIGADHTPVNIQEYVDRDYMWIKLNWKAEK